MAVKSFATVKAPTSFTVVGGTAVTLTEDGFDVKQGVHVIDTTEPNFLLRPHGTFKNRPSTLNGTTGKHSKGVRGINCTVPFLEPDGVTVSYGTFRGTTDIPPTMPLASIKQLRSMAAQMIFAPVLDEYYNYGTIA